MKKPGKGDYILAKSWRPISLLSTLGKILEAVIAERLSWTYPLALRKIQTTVRFVSLL